MHAMICLLQLIYILKFTHNYYFSTFSHPSEVGVHVQASIYTYLPSRTFVSEHGACNLIHCKIKSMTKLPRESSKFDSLCFQFYTVITTTFIIVILASHPIESQF